MKTIYRYEIKENSPTQLKVVVFNKSALTGGRGFRPYSNEDGKDAKSLKLVVIGLDGCTLVDGGLLFQYDSVSSNAVLLFDTTYITLLKSESVIHVELSGNYGFFRNVELQICYRKVGGAFENGTVFRTLYMGDTIEGGIVSIRSEVAKKYRLAVEDGDGIVELYEKELSVNGKETSVVPIRIKPDEKSGKRTAKLIASSDYCEDLKCSITVETKEKCEANLKLNFNMEDARINPQINNDLSYYLGSGKKQIGTLTLASIVAEGQYEGMFKSVKVREPTVCIEYGKDSDSSLFSLEVVGDRCESLSPGESLSYKVYFNCTEEYVKRTKNHIKFRLKWIFETELEKIDLKERELEVLKWNYSPNMPSVYSSSEKSVSAGTLTVEYTPDQGEEFKQRSGGKFVVEGDGFVFETESKSIALKSGTYPILYSLDTDLFKEEGERVLNIATNKSLSFTVQYKDNLEERTETYKFELEPIPATPILEVCYLTTKQTEEKIEPAAREMVVLPAFHYNKETCQVRSSPVCKLRFKNRQKMPCGDNRIVISGLNVKGHCALSYAKDPIELLNSSEPVDVLISLVWGEVGVDVNQLTNMILTVSFEVNSFNKGIEFRSRRNNYTLRIPVEIDIIDNCYSLDLGTTGIVVSKVDKDGNINAVKLQDEVIVPLETDENIISSVTILLDNNSKKNDGIGVVKLAPNSEEYYRNSRFIFVPIKFIVGQSKIPFIDTIQNRYASLRLEERDRVNLEKITPEHIIRATYKNIFRKISGDELDQVGRLIITYPNTYTPLRLNMLRTLILDSKIFKNLGDKLLHFVPESDAVVSYFISKRIHNGDEFKDGERILIYDMGAGTLDLSYVVISNKKGDKMIVSVERRIGIPIAGDYLDYTLYEKYKDEFENVESCEIKQWIKQFKTEWEDNKELGDYKLGIEAIKFNSERTSKVEDVAEYLNLCGNEVFKILLGEEWKTQIDRIVFSGRGSQFKPLRDKIGQELNIAETNIKLDEIEVGELKKCVASGAINYWQIFMGKDMPFIIQNKPFGLHIGIQYTILNNSKVKELVYKELVNPHEEGITWEDDETGMMKIPVVPNRMVTLDLSQSGMLIFYQTSLNEANMQELFKEENRQSIKNCFVNQLFSIRTDVIQGERKEAVMKFNIDREKKIHVIINDTELNEAFMVENVENNEFYRKCNF